LLQVLWNRRYQDHLRPHHHLALLLEPRQHVRQFVRGNKDIMGCTDAGTVGNTEFLRSADSVLEDVSKFAFEETECCVKSVVDRKREEEMSFYQNVHQKLSAELKAWLGIHPNPKVALPPGVQAAKLLQCTSDCDPFDFWSTEVIADKSCLRKAAMRVLSAKPSSCAVERVWSHFRDVFSPKRRSLLSTTLRRLVFVKLNMHMVPHDSLADTEMSEFAETNEAWVQSIVEATEQYDFDIELHKVAEQAKESDMVDVNTAARDLNEENDDIVSFECEHKDSDDALLFRCTHPCESLPVNRYL
jgi:hypothetical protein